MCVIISPQRHSLCLRTGLEWFKDSEREDFRGTGVERFYTVGPFIRVHDYRRTESFSARTRIGE
jgi:hypothetical protein